MTLDFQRRSKLRNIILEGRWSWIFRIDWIYETSLLWVNFSFESDFISRKDFSSIVSDVYVMWQMDFSLILPDLDFICGMHFKLILSGLDFICRRISLWIFQILNYLSNGDFTLILLHLNFICRGDVTSILSELDYIEWIYPVNHLDLDFLSNNGFF